MKGEEIAERRRQRHHDADARGHAQQRSGQSERERLQEKDAQQIGGIRANGLQNRQHVHALFEVRVHGHGHADSAQNHGDQADEAQD